VQNGGQPVKRLIVNADDFGRSAGVNAGTLQAHAQGIVTSATVMVLEKAAPRGIREAAERAPTLSLGLHFTLTGGGRPAAPAKDLPVLAPGGAFRRTREQLPQRIPEAEIRLELEAQIGIFQVLARKSPSHLDSHHHVALHPSVAPVVAAVARERSLPARAPTDECRRTLRAAGVRTPDAFVDRFYAEGVSFRTLEDILRELPEGTSELMCHPGFPDPELTASSTYVEEREWEVEVLCDPKIRGLVRSGGIALVGFGAL
jgi:chitin disaccharide deacetylase